MTIPISLALQGGGAHGAYSWGVLDALVADERFRVAAVSGTSAGALNAAALVQGLAEGDASARLTALWAAVGERSPLRGADMPDSPFDPLFDGLTERWIEAARNWGRFVSPYSPALPSANLLQDVVEAVIDFDRLGGAATPLFVSATNVRTGDLRVFSGAEIDARALLASACLPDLFRAVEIDGEAYWDGGYLGNPTLEPLLELEDGPADIVIVQVTPFVRAALPREPGEIMNRVNEITFNASLLRELRILGDMQALVRAGGTASPAARRLADTRVHLVPADPRLGELPPASKVDTRPSELGRLRELGWDAGRAWLASEAGKVGATGGVDLDGMLQRSV